MNKENKYNGLYASHKPFTVAWMAVLGTELVSHAHIFQLNTEVLVTCWLIRLIARFRGSDDERGTLLVDDWQGNREVLRKHLCHCIITAPTPWTEARPPQ
jgi:hypothetical protein